MKRLNLFGILCLLFGAFSAQFALAAEPWDTIKDIVTLKFMTNLGFQSTLDPFEGFIRFMLLILLFTIFFKLAEMIKLGRGAAFVIALFISLISAIFIPGSVLVAAAASYSTLVALVILGAPILLLVMTYIFLKEHHWIRVFVMVVLIYILYQMQSHIKDISTGVGISSTHFAAVMDTVGSFISWVYIVAWALGIWALLAALGSMGGSTENHPNWLRHFGRKVASKFTDTEAGKELRHSRREETRLLNDLAVEKEEDELLKKAAGETARYSQIAVTEMRNTGQINSKSHLQSLGDAHGAVAEAMKAINNVAHKWNRTQRREMSEFRRLMKELIDRSVDVEKLEATEKILLNHYIEVSKNVALGNKAFSNIEKLQKEILKDANAGYTAAKLGDTDPLDTKTIPALQKAFDKLAGEIAALTTALKDAELAEAKAVTVTASLADIIKKGWVVE